LTNDLAFVHRVLRLLRGRGIETWVFGGWAEELHGLRPPWPHGDLDLLARAPIADGLAGLHEISAKRFRHKRAFVVDGVMVELLLVEADEAGPFTQLWTYKHRWPVDVIEAGGELPLASRAAVRGYRAAHRRVDQARPTTTLRVHAAQLVGASGRGERAARA
jgi:hypothetical protein